jgi:hypothetical protein
MIPSTWESHCFPGMQEIFQLMSWLDKVMQHNVFLFSMN